MEAIVCEAPHATRRYMQRHQEDRSVVKDGRKTPARGALVSMAIGPGTNAHSSWRFGGARSKWSSGPLRPTLPEVLAEMSEPEIRQAG